ncbi:Hypothetical protein AA314_04793 [Archangium gephyra]|uniref:Uncharacterized protein n=1 Tax=Archangium gephyra TaxID=48 RepID=A0AAC8TEP0_9BACT|nr:Hypothetical protein AA314_04793 [Archangium gephyra]
MDRRGADPLRRQHAIAAHDERLHVFPLRNPCLKRQRRG